MHAALRFAQATGGILPAPIARSRRAPHNPAMGVGVEIGRKIIHLGSAGFALLYHYTNRPFMLVLMAGLTLLAVVLEIGRQRWPALQRLIQRVAGGVFRNVEQSEVTGATWVSLAILLTIALFSKPVAIACIVILAVCDSLAALIGQRFGKARFFGKSVAGSGAFFLSALLIGYWLLPSVWAAIAGAATGTLAEALDVRIGALKINDNVAIPLLTGLAFTLVLAA